MLAVIRTGGKQYLVTPGQKIKIEKIEEKEGSEIIFPEVLLLEKKNKIEIGTPLVEGAKVRGKVLAHGKGKKIIVFKYKAKTRYKVKKGHRQPYTLVEISKFQITNSK
jgi:large subunit ribosomal protein L21